jgi:glycosyltransferase involved in cell wall biosynthesis
MRVLIVVHTYPPGVGGGAEIRAERTARALQKLGHDVHAFSVHWDRHQRDNAVVDDSYRSIPVRRMWVGADHEPFRDTYDSPHVAEALSAFLSNLRPDVIHQYSGYLTSSAVVSAGLAAGVPVVVSLTDYWWLCHRITFVRTAGRRCERPEPGLCALCDAQQRRRVRWPSLVAPVAMEAAWRAAEHVPLLSRFAGIDEQRRRAALLQERLAAARLLLAPSHFIADAYRRHGIDGSRIRVMRQGVEGVERVERSRAGGIRVGYLGQIKPHKGVDLLIDAWQMLEGREAHRLTLYGPSAGAERYRHMLQQRTAWWHDVTWHPAISREELWQVLASIDVLVVPSRWAENSPNAILEAQAIGLPVVGARIGGIPELIEHDVNGLLFQPNDGADLARQLQRLIDDPVLVDRLGRQHIQVRSVDDEAREIVELYHEALAAPNVSS